MNKTLELLLFCVLSACGEHKLLPASYKALLEQAEAMTESLSDAIEGLAEANRLLNLANIRHINKTGDHISDKLYNDFRSKVQTRTSVLKEALAKFKKEHGL